MGPSFLRRIRETEAKRKKNTVVGLTDLMAGLMAPSKKTSGARVPAVGVPAARTKELGPARDQAAEQLNVWNPSQLRVEF